MNQTILKAASRKNTTTKKQTERINLFGNEQSDISDDERYVIITDEQSERIRNLNSGVSNKQIQSILETYQDQSQSEPEEPEEQLQPEPEKQFQPDPEKPRRFKAKTTSGREYSFNPDDLGQGLNPIDDIAAVEDPGPSELKTAINEHDANVDNLWKVSSNKQVSNYTNNERVDFAIATDPNYIVNRIGTLVPSLDMFVITPTKDIIKHRFVRSRSETSDIGAMTYVRRLVNGSDKHDVFVASEPFFGAIGTNFYHKVAEGEQVNPDGHRGMANSVESVIGEDPLTGDPTKTVSYFGHLGIRVALADHKNVEFNKAMVHSNLYHNYDRYQKEYGHKGDTEVIDLAIPIDNFGPGVYHLAGFDVSFVVLEKGISTNKVDAIFKELMENRISTWDDVLLHQLENNRVPGMLSPMKCIINTDSKSVADTKFYATMGMFPIEVTVNKIRSIEGSEIHKNRVTVVFQDSLTTTVNRTQYIRVDFNYDKIVKGYTGIKVFDNTVLAIGTDYKDVCKKSADAIMSAFYSDELSSYEGDISKLFNTVEKKSKKIDSLKAANGKLEKKILNLETKVVKLAKERDEKNEELCEVTGRNEGLLKQLDAQVKAKKNEADICKAKANADSANAKMVTSHVKAEADISTAQSKVIESRLKLGITIATFCIAAFGLYRTYSKDKGIMNKLTSKSYSFSE